MSALKIDRKPVQPLNAKKNGIEDNAQNGTNETKNISKPIIWQKNLRKSPSLLTSKPQKYISHRAESN